MSDRAKQDLATSIEVQGEWTSSGELRKDLESIFAGKSSGVRRKYEYVAVKMLRLDRSSKRIKSAQHRIGRVAQQSGDASWQNGRDGQQREQGEVVDTAKSSDLDHLLQRFDNRRPTRSSTWANEKYNTSKHDWQEDDWGINAQSSPRPRDQEARPPPNRQPLDEGRQHSEARSDHLQGRQAGGRRLPDHRGYSHDSYDNHDNRTEGLLNRRERRARYKDRLDNPQDHQDRQDRQGSSPRSQSTTHEGPDFVFESIPYTTAASTFLYGRRSICSALQARKRKAYNLYLLNNRDWRSVPEVAEIIRLARASHVSIDYLSPSSLDALVRKTSRNAGESVDPVHDGICLETSPYPQLPVRHLGECDQLKHTYDLTLESQSREEAAINGQPSHLSYHHDGWRHPFLLWLHGTVDMRNVGAIMRTCVYFGVDVILSARGTPSAGFHKTSAGASEYLNLLRVRNEETFIHESQQWGWQFYSAVAPGTVRKGYGPKKKIVLAEEMQTSPLTEGPCVLVLGNEDLGLPGAFVKMTDCGVGIGGRTNVAATAGLDSLNVGVAAALLIERFLRKPGKAQMAALKATKEEKLF